MLAATIACCLVAAAVFASGAAAKPATPTTIDIYDVNTLDGKIAVVYAQIFSPKKACQADRRTKLVFLYNNKKPKVIDIGVSSGDGAFALRYRSTQLSGVAGFALVAAASSPGKTKCAKAKVKVTGS